MKSAQNRCHFSSPLYLIIYREGEICDMKLSKIYRKIGNIGPKPWGWFLKIDENDQNDDKNEQTENHHFNTNSIQTRKSNNKIIKPQANITIRRGGGSLC